MQTQIQTPIHIKMNLGKSHNYRIDPLECTSLQIEIQKEIQKDIQKEIPRNTTINT